MGRQIIRSWAGRQLLDEISDLIQVNDDKTGKTVLLTLEKLLQKQPEVSTLDLLEALPSGKIRLDLDGLLQVAVQWRSQLQSQKRLVSSLTKFPAEVLSKEIYSQTIIQQSSKPKSISLSTTHRFKPIKLELWRPVYESQERKNIVIFMPGLGGSPKHFHWLAHYLSSKGWPVIMLEHPGSDPKAVQALLEGRSPPPGAEVLPGRLADLEAVLNLGHIDGLSFHKKGVVLIGHSLGALTAFLASGAYPLAGLTERCRKDLNALSLSNPSSLLQCQLVDVKLKRRAPISQLKAIVGLNSFGSLLWPNSFDARVPVPVLLSGGTLDLITPPKSEQLKLMLSTPAHKGSRVVLIKGASHFSAVRIETSRESNSDDLFKLGKELVGSEPLLVQKALIMEIITFLRDIENDKGIKSSSHKQLGDLQVHTLNRSSIENLVNLQ